MHGKTIRYVQVLFLLALWLSGAHPQVAHSQMTQHPISRGGSTEKAKMDKISIEPGDSSEVARCADCGGTTRSVTGFVYKNNQARAIYYARWTDNHLERGVDILVSIGEWGEGTTGKMRNSVGVDCRMGSDRPGFMIVDAATLPWQDEKLLGKALTRVDVMKSAIKEEVFHILDHLVVEDKRLHSFLTGNRP